MSGKSYFDTTGEKKQAMRKRERGRGECSGSSDRQQVRLLMAVVIAMYCQEALAIYPPSVALLYRRTIPWCCKNRQDATRERIKSLVLLQSRGGAASAGVNWDEPYYSDSSDGEEHQGSNFLPDREESIKEEVVESEPPEPVDFEGDDTDEDDDESFLDSPFLHSFQREIHSIVRDYRQEVSETFQHLKEDIIYSRDRLDSPEIPPKRRPSRRRSPSSRGNTPPSREAERTGRKSTPTRRVPKPADLEEDCDNDDEDAFVVGDSDEDNDEVLMKLNPAPRARFAMGEDSSDGEEDAIAIQKKQLRKRLETEMDDDDDDGDAVIDSEEEEEEDELAFRLMDDWASTNKNNAWDNNVLENNAFDDSPRQEDVAEFRDGTMSWGIKEKQVDDENQSSSRKSDSKKAGKKRRKRRKKSPTFPPSGGDQSTEEPHSADLDVPKEPDFIEEKDSLSSNSGSEPVTPDSRAPIENNTFEDPSNVSTSMGSSTSDQNLAVPQVWKAATVVISFLVMAILINTVLQILSRLLWKKPE